MKLILPHYLFVMLIILKNVSQLYRLIITVKHQFLQNTVIQWLCPLNLHKLKTVKQTLNDIPSHLGILVDSSIWIFNSTVQMGTFNSSVVLSWSETFWTWAKPLWEAPRPHLWESIELWGAALRLFHHKTLSFMLSLNCFRTGKLDHDDCGLKFKRQYVMMGFILYPLQACSDSADSACKQRGGASDVLGGFGQH